MTASEDVTTDVDDIIETPIDLTSVDKPRLLFYLANKTPLSIADFAEECTNQSFKIKSILRNRFEAEINIDITDSIRLSGDARRAVIKGGKPLLRSGQKLFERGQSHADDDNYTAAANCFEQAASIFQTVRERFEAVDHESSELDRLITMAKNRHDSAAKEAAKDSINYHVLRAMPYESEGDKQVERQPSRAREEYQKAVEELSQALEITKEYNQSRLASNSSMLSLDPITEKLSTISEKLKSIRHTLSDSSNDSSSDSDDESLPDEETSPDSSGDSQRESEAEANEPSETQLLEEIERLTADMNKVPSSEEMQSRGKYDSHQYYSAFGTWKDAVEQADVDIRQALIADLRSVANQLEKRPTTTEIDKHGVYNASRYQNYFGTWEGALEAADIRRISDEELVAEIQKLDEDLEKLPTSVEMRDSGEYSVQEYLRRFDSWDEALEAAGINKRDRLIEELQRLADELNQVPTTTQMNETGQYSSTYFSNEFGSWEAALEAADLSSLDTSAEKGQASEGESSDTATLPPSTPIENIRSHVDSVGPQSISRLKSAGYTTLGDLRNTKPREVAKHRGIGRTKAQKLIRFATEQVSNNGTPSGQPSNHRPSANVSSSPTLESSSNRIQPSALDTSWETIPANERINGQFLLQVTDVDQQVGNRKTARLDVRDQNGREFGMDIWSKHNIDREWREGEWYALENARGKVWESGDGTTRKRLSSTKDLNVVELGADFDPNTVSVGDLSEAGSEPQQSGATTDENASGSASEPTTSSRDTATTIDDGESSEDDAEVHNDGVLGDIMSDFDEI